MSIGRRGIAADILLGGGVFALLLATVSGHLYSVDGLAYYRTATELAWRGSLFIDPPFIWGTYITDAPVWPVGYSLVLAPAAAMAWPFRELQPIFDASDPYNLAVLYADPVYMLMGWVNPLIVATTAVVTSALARRLGVTPRMAIVIALVTAFGSPLLFYARADFPHPLAALLLVSAVLMALRVRDGAAQAAWLALVCGWAILVRPVDGGVTTIVALTILAVPRSGWSGGDQVRRLALVACGATIGVATGSAVNVVRRGAPFDYGQGGNWIRDPVDVLNVIVAYLVSPGRGLPWHFPLIVAAPLGALILLRSSKRLEALALVLPVALFLAVYSFWGELGNWGYGPRLLVPVLSFAAILAGIAWQAASNRAATLAFAGLAIAGVIANSAVILVDQLAFWGIRGNNFVDTPGFWAQYEFAAYAPIGSLALYDPASLANAADIMWLRALPWTGGTSAVVAVGLAAAGLVAIWRAWRRLVPTTALVQHVSPTG